MTYLRLVALIVSAGALALGGVLGGLSGLLVAGIAVFMVAVGLWLLRTFGDSHTAWAQGLYGDAERVDEHGYSRAVRRLARRSR